jgi:PAS domain S-box-containing protein
MPTQRIRPNSIAGMHHDFGMYRTQRGNETQTERITVHIEALIGQIASVRSRVGRLAQHSDASLQLPDLLSPLFKELDVAFRTLQIAEEVLLQQQDVLTTAHERLEAERRHYQELFAFAPDAYLMTTANGTIQEANSAAARLLNASQSSLVGSSLVMFVADYTRRAFRHDLSRLRWKDGLRTWEVRLQPQGGDSFDATLTIAPIRDVSEMLVGLRWRLRDAIAHKQAEERIHTLHMGVERHVQELITLLEAVIAAKENELDCEQASRSEEAAIRDHQTLLVTAAHELKPPLAAIIDYAELLQRRIMLGDRLKNRDLHGLRTIAEQGRLLTSLVDLLLDAACMVQASLAHQTGWSEVASEECFSSAGSVWLPQADEAQRVTKTL